MRHIPYSRQFIDLEDIRAVSAVLKSAWVTRGPKAGEFEKALCRYTGAKYAVVLSNGTAALHLACLAAGLRNKDEAITSPMTFLASANCVLYCRAKPVFADILQESGNIDPGKIQECVNNRTKAIIPVHFAGLPCRMEEIRRIAKRHKLLVIEDAAHALGAAYKGAKIGACKYSDMTVFSFHPTKSITTGEGGAVMTNKKDLYDRLMMLRNHGIAKGGFISEPDGAWYYEMQSLGYNYRMTDFQAALGISQLKKLGRFISARRKIAKIYASIFRGNPYFDLPPEEYTGYSACHLYIIRLKRDFASKRKAVFLKLMEKGLGVQVHYMPIYLHPYYRGLGYKNGICPCAEDFYQREISIPLHPAMDRSAVLYAAKAVLGAMESLC